MVGTTENGELDREVLQAIRYSRGSLELLDQVLTESYDLQLAIIYLLVLRLPNIIKIGAVGTMEEESFLEVNLLFDERSQSLPLFFHRLDNCI